MRTLFFCFLTLILHSTLFAQIQEGVVTIEGYVTDYDGNPIDGCSVFWQGEDFSTLSETITDKNGYYSVNLAKGVYQAMGGMYMPDYPVLYPDTPEEDQRLEFWAWNFIADRDTTVNFRYHRMEAYGLHAFYIPGPIPTYQIYVRPMSLTRYQAYTKAGSPPEAILAPSADNLKVVVWIDGEEVTVRMKQEIKEYFEPGEWGNAYLITVDKPRKSVNNLPYRIFKMELTDLENGDRGEGMYYMKKDIYK